MDHYVRIERSTSRSPLIPNHCALSLNLNLLKKFFESPPEFSLIWQMTYSCQLSPLLARYSVFKLKTASL